MYNKTIIYQLYAESSMPVGLYEFYNRNFIYSAVAGALVSLFVYTLSMCIPIYALLRDNNYGVWPNMWGAKFEYVILHL